MSQKKNVSTDLTAVRFPTWPRTDTRPTPPLARLSFRGLSIFCYNSPRCEIGFLRNDDGRHELRVKAWEYDPATPQTRIPIQLPAPTRMMAISLQNANAGVKFLEQAAGSPYNFGNMLDLNGEEFWPGFKLKGGKFAPRLMVDNGTFLSLELTKYKFDRVEVPIGPLEILLRPENPYPLNNFLDVAGAEIGLAGNKKIAVTIDNEAPILLPRVDGHSVEIQFDNECRVGNNECDFDRHSRFETRRGDFHFHRQALSVSTFDPKYGLLLNPNQIISEDDDKLGTDLAPCMAVGAGEAPGLP